MYRIIGYAEYDYLTPGRALNAFCPVSLLANRSIGRTPFDSTQYSVVYYFPFTRNVASFPGCVGSFSADDAVARLHFRDTKPAAYSKYALAKIVSTVCYTSEKTSHAASIIRRLRRVC